MKIRLLLLTILLLQLVSCQHLAQRPFTFIQMCDPQLGMGGYEHDKQAFMQAVAQINGMDCDFVVICGDLVHHRSDSSFADFLEIAGGFDKPLYLVAGNHDVGNIPNDTTLLYYREKLGDDYYSFVHKGVPFMVVNTQLWKTDVGEASEIHERWFSENLKKLHGKRRPVVIAGHHPLYVDDPGEEEEYFNIPPEKRKELLEHFIAHGVVAYLSGHKHETLINRYRDIQLVTGESTSKNFDQRPLGFREWYVSRDTIMHRFIPLESVNHP